MMPCTLRDSALYPAGLIELSKESCTTHQMCVYKLL